MKRGIVRLKVVFCLSPCIERQVVSWVVFGTDFVVHQPQRRSALPGQPGEATSAFALRYLVLCIPMIETVLGQVQLFVSHLDQLLHVAKKCCSVCVAAPFQRHACWLEEGPGTFRGQASSSLKSRFLGLVFLKMGFCLLP